MKDGSARAEWAIALPLGVLANQLMKVEADLRLLSAKACTYVHDRNQPGIASQLAARLEQINETLESIRGLIAELEADIQPVSASPKSLNSRDSRDKRDD